MRPAGMLLIALWLGLSAWGLSYFVVRPTPAPAELPLVAGSCTSEPAMVLIGRPYTPENAEDLAAEAKRLSGASSVRIVKKGDPSPGDYRPGRLNVFLDSSGLVEELLCG